MAVLPTGLGKSAIYQLISKGPYSQRHVKNRRRTPWFLLAYKVERYLHQVLLLKLMYQSNRSFNIPPRATPRVFEFLEHFCSNSPSPAAEKPFKCPIIGLFQVIKCPTPGKLLSSFYYAPEAVIIQMVLEYLQI